ncbi:hypothetical protein V1Y59_14035 [Gordonia sp. PKS22-38]|uniref:LGFP repeat-containing protein n=1 Tax=Gordonia prachuapensis TaxID=3115651 RepID=A0ABU7MV51_9ACTN|nr:hypothetical protein [Gordonia sp. PKS22-38]
MTTTTRRRARNRVAGLVLGILALAGSAFLATPTAVADPQSDAQSAIAELSDQIDSGDVDGGRAGSGLGDEEGSLEAVGDGYQQEFANGTVFWSPDNGARVLYGAILSKYDDEGGPTGSLGFPASNEAPADDGSSARVAEFAAADRPQIYWTPDDGAWVVRGPFTVATDELGSELGAPTADMTRSGDVMSQEFANGTITYDTASGEWTSSPDDGWADQLAGSPIPGTADPSDVGASSADTNATDDATEGSGWWWLLIPFLIILVGLMLIWLFRKFGQPVGARDQHTDDAPDTADRADAAAGPDGTTAGLVGAAAAGTVAGGAAIAADRPDAEDADATPGDEVPGGESESADAESGAPVGDTASTDEPVLDEPADDATPDDGATVLSDAEVADAGTESDVPAAAVGSTTAAAPLTDETMPLSLEELMAEDISEVMSPPDDAELGLGDTSHHASGDGVGSYYRNGEKLPVPLGAHLPLDGDDPAPEGYPVKADVAAGVYHTPDQASYGDVVPEIWFASESAAESAHFRRADAD